jgi:hypothetical protein
MQWRILNPKEMNIDNTTSLSLPSRLSVSLSSISNTTTLFTLSTIVVWILLWNLRSRDDPTRKQDAIIFSILLSWRCLSFLQAFASSLLSQILMDSNTTYFLAVVGTGGAGFAIVRALIHPHYEANRSSTGDHPWILPSRTTHSRMFPKKHSFAHSYLQVSVPVDFEGRCGSLISVGNVKKQGWLHVQGSDYLDRMSSETTLEGKLSEYLHSQVRKFPTSIYLMYF